MRRRHLTCEGPPRLHTQARRHLDAWSRRGAYPNPQTPSNSITAFAHCAFCHVDARVWSFVRRSLFFSSPERGMDLRGALVRRGAELRAYVRGKRFALPRRWSQPPPEGGGGGDDDDDGIMNEGDNGGNEEQGGAAATSAAAAATGN